MRNDVKQEIEQANDKLSLGIKGDFDKVTSEFAAVREEMKDCQTAAAAKIQFEAMMAAINGMKSDSSDSKAKRTKA